MRDREPKPAILLVEDEERIREGLCDVLIYHGYEPTPAATGEQGLELGLGSAWAAVILDIMLPGKSGFDVCRELRAAGSDVPIMMLTAKGSEDDIVTGLSCGADDYVTKPFSVREVVARVEALLRRQRQAPPEPEVLSFGGWSVNIANLRASAGRRHVELTPREAALVRVFVRERGRIVSRRALLKEVWGMPSPEEIETRTVDMHIVKLRKKLGRAGRTLIETVRGAGYRAAG